MAKQEANQAGTDVKTLQAPEIVEIRGSIVKIEKAEAKGKLTKSGRFITLRNAVSKTTEVFLVTDNQWGDATNRDKRAATFFEGNVITLQVEKCIAGVTFFKNAEDAEEPHDFTGNKYVLGSELNMDSDVEYQSYLIEAGLPMQLVLGNAARLDDSRAKHAQRLLSALNHVDEPFVGAGF